MPHQQYFSYTVAVLVLLVKKNGVSGNLVSLTNCFTSGNKYSLHTFPNSVRNLLYN